MDDFGIQNHSDFGIIREGAGGKEAMREEIKVRPAAI